MNHKVEMGVEFGATLEIEEPIYRFVPARNGAGPLWNLGGVNMVRSGERVFVCGQELLANQIPLNNVRCLVFERNEDGWVQSWADKKERQREPCLLGVYSDGRLWLSTNPTLTDPDEVRGPSNPHLLQFSVENMTAQPTAWQPGFTLNPGFDEHSYRCMGVDGTNGELIVFNNFSWNQQYWSYLDREGQWANAGVIDYPERCCYQNIALQNGICHMLAVTDIQEPNEIWKDWKREQFARQTAQGSAWDYVFRRLYYLVNTDVAREQFIEKLEIDSVEETAGHIRNLDLWIDDQGAAHFLYLKENIAVPAMRDVFFPDIPIITSLEYCIVQQGSVTNRQTLIEFGEDSKSSFWDARFHSCPDGQLFVFYSLAVAAEGATTITQNYLAQIMADGKLATPLLMPLQNPLTRFSAASQRGGTAPSNALDLYGSTHTNWGVAAASECVEQEMRYVRIRIEKI